MQIVYDGPKLQKIVQFPLPLVSKADVRYEHVFQNGQPTEIDEKWGRQVLEQSPEFFHAVKPDKPATSKNVDASGTTVAERPTRSYRRRSRGRGKARSRKPVSVAQAQESTTV